MSIEIIKGRPAPQRYVATGRPSKYPFAELSPGDSFDVPVKRGEKLAEVLTRVRSSAASYRQRKTNGEISFIVRESADKPNAVTVWCLAPFRASKKRKVKA